MYSCFLSHPGAFWGAFLAPIIVVLIFNFVIFIWIIVVLIRHTKGIAARKKESVSNKTILRLIISISGVMFLFGLTWLFAILTFSVTGLRETFQILFTIFNSLQGFFVFLFFCVFNNEAREAWKELLSCKRCRSKSFSPLQAKTSSGAVAKKSNSSGSTGLSPTSVEKSAPSSKALTSKDDVENAPSKETVTLESVQSSTENDRLIGADVVTVEQTGSESTHYALYKDEVAVNATKSLTQEENRGGKKYVKSLKARIKRYSTKRIFKHHVEEVEIDFNSDSSTHESSDGEDDTTLL